MAAFAILAAALGFDSLRAAAALGLLPRAARRLGLVLAFGVFDGLATLSGLLLGRGLLAALDTPARVASALLVGGYGLWLAFREDDDTPGSPTRLWLWIPAAASLDNLGAGIALSGSPMSAGLAAVGLGATSALFAAAGLWTGDLLRSRIPLHASRVGGMALVAIAVAQGTGIG
jgi:putative Mn2+ efflux pump MntP